MTRAVPSYARSKSAGSRRVSEAPLRIHHLIVPHCRQATGDSELEMQRLLRRFRARPVLGLRLYGKPGCHLCDDAREILARLSRRYAFTVEEVDIRSDPALFRKYDIRIPVIDVDGFVELQAPITEREVKAALERAQRHHREGDQER